MVAFILELAMFLYALLMCICLGVIIGFVGKCVYDEVRGALGRGEKK